MSIRILSRNSYREVMVTLDNPVYGVDVVGGAGQEAKFEILKCNWVYNYMNVYIMSVSLSRIVQRGVSSLLRF